MKPFWGVATLMLAVDQAVKAWVRGAIPTGGSFQGLPWPGVFELTLTYNRGVAFGLFQGFGHLLAPVAVAIAVGAAWIVHRRKPSTLGQVSLGLLVAGAVGNLIDRVWLGQVTDMFWIRVIDFPVFNVADACISVAAVLLVLFWGREETRETALTHRTDP
jgi:signal peptidase II